MDQYIGRLLDNRYEILEIIGTGGMAVVYKARCHRLNRLVAIKILKDEFSRDEEFRRRFHHEGEAVAMLSHPNIVQVYDVSSSDNANYIVMELIDGITLKQYMEKKGVLNWKETLHFGMQIAKALEHAHSRSIVHRDIKPHNVMVLKNGSVKVTDFGIARVMSKSNTLTKEALGSVHYISPEQAKGGWVDNRSDLYSLGVVMYEMMTGRPPYDGESPVAVAIQHINGGAAMPSSLNPNIPGGLEQIIMRGMALDVKDRYASATEMLKDLDEFRKDPGILFIFPSHGVGGETKVLPSAAQLIAEGQKPRTTAEKVAATAAGTAGAAAAAAAVRNRSTAQQRPQTGEMPRTSQAGARPVANGQRSAAGTTARTTAGTSARPASAQSQPAKTSLPPRKTREEIREEIREEERNRVATIAIVACSAVAIIAIIIFLVLLLNGALLGQGSKMVTVPKLVGEYYDNVGDITGLKVEIGDYVHSDMVEKGKILEQKPAYLTEVAQNSIIKVVVSMGPEPEVKKMENLAGMLQVDAEKYLDRLGMIPMVRQELSDAYEVGYVVRTFPAEGDELEEGQTVYIYVCSGPLITKAVMPDLVGKAEVVALNQLKTYKFTDVKVEYEESDMEEGLVIKQSILKNTEVDVTTKVVLTVSSGPAPKVIKMPDVVGLTSERAKKMLEDYGVNLDNVSTKYEANEAPKGQVIRQSVAENTELKDTTKILLTISAGPLETEPPTEAPTEAPVKEVTVHKTFTLPSDRAEDYVLGLYQNGTQVIEDTMITAGQTSIQVSLTGTGTQYYDLYINNEYYKTEKVEFTTDG